MMDDGKAGRSADRHRRARYSKSWRGGAGPTRTVLR